MGLDTTHDCWHGAYSAFNRWRCKIAEAAGLPPLELMEGFYIELFKSDAFLFDSLPIKWSALKDSPLHILLNHSDCDGSINKHDCLPIAEKLERLLPLLSGNGGYREKTQQFIDGLRLAASLDENVGFY